MGVFEQFPYANMHEMNLDWLLKKMKELAQAMETFKATESLKFADPIIWDISTQYEKSTIVLDPTGNAYLSIQAVPAGVQLNDSEYWLEIFNFTDYTRTANQNLTVNVETNTTRATAAYQVNDWLIWNDVLYKVTAAIAIDDALIVAPAAGSNIVHFTVEDFIKAFITYATGLIQQYKNDIDASELAYRQQLAQDIATTTASLQAQLDAIIAGATVDSEVIDARVGAYAETYTTLGNAIRNQILYAHNLIDGYRQEDAGIYSLPIQWEFGYYTSAGVKTASTSWIRSNTTYKATDVYSYIDLGGTPLVKITVVDLTTATASSEINTSRYYQFTKGHVYTFNARLISSGTLNPSDGDTVAINFYPKSVLIEETVTQNNYSTLLPDADNAPVNSHFRIVYTTTNANYPLHLPDLTNERRRQTFIATLETVAQYKDNAYYCTQTLTTFNAIYTRYKSLIYGTWSTWVSSQETNAHQFALQITDSNISTLLPDLDNAKPNTYYNIFISTGHDPLHSPEVIATSSIILVFTFGSDTHRTQMYQRRDALYFRNYVNGIWTRWWTPDKPYRYVVGSIAEADFSSLVECIEEAIQYPNSVVTVLPGTYDIISEYSALHPDDWETRNDSRGVNLQNNITLIFSSGAKVVANYTGNNPDILTNFSVFNMRYGSATLINAIIEASNIRYCIHDDFWTSPISYHNEYLRCKMSMDNSQNSERSKYPHCIGGGFGQNGDTVIKDCIFEGVGGSGGVYPSPDDSSIVSYHNGPNATQYSKLVMTGCYFKGVGTFRSLSNGTEVRKSDLLLSNNSFGSAIVEGYTSGANTPNMNVIAFNNEIR